MSSQIVHYILSTMPMMIGFFPLYYIQLVVTVVTVVTTFVINRSSHFNLHCTEEVHILKDDIKEPSPLTIYFLKILSHEGDDEDGKDIIKDVDLPIHSHKNIFLDIEADQGNDEEDELSDKIEDGSPSHSGVILFLALKHNLAKAIQRIEESYQISTQDIMAPATRKIPTRMYVFTVNFNKQGFLVIIFS
ncbi:hypothetical protein BDR04DRAFT_1118336 [Suillus decipiens]|nr:hypothetical protein BDR04DRAFT_1118336 [Suillus decipiens]